MVEKTLWWTFTIHDSDSCPTFSAGRLDNKAACLKPLYLNFGDTHNSWALEVLATVNTWCASELESVSPYKMKGQGEIAFVTKDSIIRLNLGN